MATGTSARRRADRREQILEATLRVVARDGLDGIRSAVVAREAGVSPALPHYYYPTLDDLVVAAYALDERRTWGAIPVDADPLDVLHGSMAAFFVGDDEANRSRWMLWHEYVRRATFDERVHDAVAPRLDRWGEAIAVAVRRLQSDGRVPAHVEPRLAVLLLASTWAGQSALALLGLGSGADAEAAMRAQVDGLAVWPAPARTVWRPPVPALPDGGIEEERGDAILDAALRVMSRSGVKGVHFPEVAAEAEVSESLPRYYFPNREQLLAAAFGRSAMRARGRVLARAARIDDPLERLHDACAWETAADPGDMHDNWVVLNELLRRGFVDEGARVRAQERLRTWIAYLAGPIDELRADGRVAPAVDPVAAARRLVAIELGLGVGLLFGVFTVGEFAYGIDAAIALELGLDQLPARP